MRVAVNNANLDMDAQYENYVCRITDDDGDAGKALLEEFSKIDSDEPVIVTTSQLLTTGVDLPSVRNIVDESLADGSAHPVGGGQEPS